MRNLEGYWGVHALIRGRLGCLLPCLCARGGAVTSQSAAHANHAHHPSGHVEMENARVRVCVCARARVCVDGYCEQFEACT